MGDLIIYIETKYLCNVCNTKLIYENYGEIESTMLYCKVCNSTPALTKDGKKTDISKLRIDI
jgi:Zn finger protein HypA/HybF involved in hydrogenase expression